MEYLSIKIDIMSISNYKKRFYQLMESQIGDVKPIISENEMKEDDIDLTSTYLSKDEISKRRKEITQFETMKSPKVVDLTGKIFKDLETTTSEDYIGGLDFKQTEPNYYKVNFSSEFIEKFFSIPYSKIYKNFGLYGNEHGDPSVPLILKFGSQEYTIQELLNNIYIFTEGYPTNRIHFDGGVGSFLEGTGLGYLIYQQFIKYLGYGSSMTNASSKAQVVWSKLTKDPDFYSFIIEIGGSQSVYVISKTISFETPESIVEGILERILYYGSNDIKVILGSEIKKDFPEIEKMFSNPNGTVLRSLMKRFKSYVELLTSSKLTKDIDEFLFGKISEVTLKIYNIISNDRHPFRLTELIDNDVKELFDKVIKKYYVDSSVDFNSETSTDGTPYWERKNEEGKKMERSSTYDPQNGMTIFKWDDGTPYYSLLELSLSEISKFFSKYFKLKKYNEGIMSTFK